MPRNSSGTYNLVAGNPVITGTIIQSDWANTTMPDIGNELTDSLSRSGKGGMTAPLSLLQGSAASPAMTFGSFPQSGMYAATANDIRMSVAGVDRFRWLNANALPQTWDSDGGVWLDVGGGGVIWSEVDVLPNPVMISNGYTTLGGQTAVFPPNPPAGFSIAFADKADNWSATNFLTLDGNGNTFTQDGSGTYILDLKGAFAQFSFLEGQWQIVNFGRLSDYYGVDTGDFALKTAQNDPNLFINGGLDIWQRGSNIICSNSATYTADRWFGFNCTHTENIQLRRTSVVLKDVTAGFARIGQRIESASRLSGSTVTFSFYNEVAEFDNGESYISFKFESGAAVLVQTPTDFETVGDKTFTVALNNDAVVGDYLEVLIVVNKTTVQGGAVVSSLKFEIGSVATRYQARPIAEELALCQRYYYRTTLTQTNIDSFCWGFASTNVSHRCQFKYPVTMRAKPAGSFSGAADFNVISNLVYPSTSVTFNAGIGVDETRIDFGTATGPTFGAGVFVRAANANAWLAVDAEL